MKKKILLILLIPTLLLTVTACGKKENKETSDTKTITLNDTNKGYKTTFTYNKSENYQGLEVATGAASTEITFKNEDKDVEFQMYYNDTSTNSYETAKKNRSEQKYFKEYKLGKYEGYVYGEYDDGLYVIIKLDEDSNNNAVLLFTSITRIDDNKDIVISNVFEKELKEFFSTIKFKKTK